MLSDTKGVTYDKCITKGKEDTGPETKGKGDIEGLIEDLTDALGEFHALAGVCSTLKEVVEQLLSRLPQLVVST